MFCRKWYILRKAKLANLPPYVDHKWAMWPGDDEVAHLDHSLIFFMGIQPAVFTSNMAENVKLLSERPQLVEVGLYPYGV